MVLPTFISNAMLKMHTCNIQKYKLYMTHLNALNRLGQYINHAFILFKVYA